MGSNHQPHGCLLNRLFGRRSQKISKLRLIGLSAGNSPGTGEFSAQMASYAENVSIWWCHHVRTIPPFPLKRIGPNWERYWGGGGQGCLYSLSGAPARSRGEAPSTDPHGPPLTSSAALPPAPSTHPHGPRWPPPPRPAQPSAPTPTAPRTTPPNAPSAAPSTLPLGYPHHPTNRPLRGSQHPPPRHPTDSRPAPPPQPPAPRPHGTTHHTLHHVQRSPQG